MISSRHIRSYLKGEWKWIRYIFLTDKKYHEVPLAVLDDFLEQDKTNALTYKKAVGECEEFALVLHAEFRKYQWLNLGLDHNYAFGECIATKLMGRSYVHSLNCCFGEDGKFYLIEPQTDDYWLSSRKHDELYFVKM